ncbi:MAG: transposase [Thermomicrobiales bacterium]|nr:transposase [Thermomicrobiales bacterium]
MCFKLYVVRFCEGIRSERQLLALAADRRSVRWYLGYARDEALPDASGFTRFRSGAARVHPKRAGASTQPFRTRPRTSSGSTTIEGRPPASRRSESAMCGSSRSSRQPGRGMAGTSFGGGAGPTSTSRRCPSRRGRP